MAKNESDCIGEDCGEELKMDPERFREMREDILRSINRSLGLACTMGDAPPTIFVGLVGSLIANLQLSLRMAGISNEEILLCTKALLGAVEEELAERKARRGES